MDISEIHDRMNARALKAAVKQEQGPEARRVLDRTSRVGVI